MSDEEFEEFLGAAMDELSSKQESLKAEHGFGGFARWHFDQETEELAFFDENDRQVLAADVIDIGSYASNSSTWKWAWSNDSVLPSLRQKAEPLKALADITGIGIFAQEEAFSIEDESMAWELAAMGVRHLNAMGVYRAPSSSGGLASFLAITSIRSLPDH